MFGEGYIPPEQDRSVEDDDSGFKDVVKLLGRSWPYIKPQFLGRWWTPENGLEDRAVDNLEITPYHSRYAPFLVAFVAFAGPLLGIVPASLQWPVYLLYAPIAVMVMSMYFMSYASSKGQVFATFGLLLSGLFLFAVSAFVIDGAEDGYYALGIVLACFFGWCVQYKTTDGKLKFRIRGATHLVYFCAIAILERLLELSLALVIADLLNQNLLQNDPIAPGLASVLGLPELSQGAVDTLTSEQRHDLKWTLGYITMGITLIQVILRAAIDYYAMWIMQRINQDLRMALLARWHQLSMRYHSDHRTGDSIFRIYQDSAVVTAVIMKLLGILLALVTYYIMVGLVTLLSPLIGFIAGVLVVPGFIWAHWAMPRMRVRTLVYRAATSNVTSTIQETFGAIKLIKAFGTAERAEKKLEEDSIIAFNAAFRVRVLVALVTIVMFTIAASFMISGEFLMAWWAHNANPTFSADLIALVGVSFVVWNLASFSWSRDQFRESSKNLRRLLRDWLTVQDIAMGLHRVFDILDIEPDVKDSTDAIPLSGFEHEIRFNDVSFAYEKSRPVLNGINFSTKPGSVTAIIGPTGSGKTTAMSLLLRLFDVDKGSITIDGKDIREYQVDSLRVIISIALQENVLFAMSVRDNIRYVAKDADEKAIQEAVRIAAMDDFVSSLPFGLDTVLSDRGGKLSTGQRQRLSIARAVVRNAPVLILDEPTAALDAATEHRVMSNLTTWVREAHGESGQPQGRAIFLITHRISTIRRADNILYLDSGRIVESGDHETLMQIENGRYRRFVESESNLTNRSESHV